MSLIVYSPSWFFGFDAVFHSVSVIVALLISMMAYRIFRLLKESSFFYFSAAFFAIGISYIFKILSDLFVYRNLGEMLAPKIDLILASMTAAEFVNIFGNLIFRFLILLGFLILLVILLKIKDRRIIFLFIYFIFIISTFSAWSFLLFQTTLTVLAGTVCIYYLFHYIEHRKRIIFFSLLGFSFVFLAQVTLMFTFFFQKQMFVLGSIFQAIGFLILFITYLMVLQR
ncbi:MAG: hypothetical protein ACOC32_00040 [Nanoarchaeota archaeon]